MVISVGEQIKFFLFSRRRITNDHYMNSNSIARSITSCLVTFETFLRYNFKMLWVISETIIHFVKMGFENTVAK
jgi:hypothetical protein